MEPISDRLYSTANLFQSSATQFSWATSNLKTFCQDRIFKAMPLKYQALLKATNFSVYQRTVNNNNITYSIVNDTNNYVYLPSYAEIVNSNTYQNMTADNFVIRTVSHWNNTGSSNGLICNNSRTNVGNWSGTNTETFTKSYNPSTGVLTCYLNDTGNCDNIESWNRNTNVYAYALEKSFV